MDQTQLVEPVNDRVVFRGQGKQKSTVREGRYEKDRTMSCGEYRAMVSKRKLASHMDRSSMI